LLFSRKKRKIFDSALSSKRSKNRDCGRPEIHSINEKGRLFPEILVALALLNFLELVQRAVEPLEDTSEGSSNQRAKEVGVEVAGQVATYVLLLRYLEEG